MKLLLLFLIGLAATFAKAEPESAETASLSANVDILSIDGELPVPASRHSIKTGARRVTASYRSFRWTYICEFNWKAEANKHYEIIDRSLSQPLIMHELRRVNIFWHDRSNPVKPTHCRQLSRTDH